MHLSFTPDAPAMPEIGFDDFLAVDIRIGTIIEAAALEGARKPSIKMVIDFGHVIGSKKSSAQITEHYAPDALIGLLAGDNKGKRLVHVADPAHG